MRRQLFKSQAPFIGRASELDALRASIKNHRVTTLTGLGGVGKTRLAVEYLQGISRPVTMVWLDEISQPDLIPGQLTKALGLSVTGETDLDRALGALQHQDQPILFLDNAEHVVDEIIDLVERLPTNVTVLVTSQIPLRVAGEAQIVVPEFDAADSLAMLNAYAVNPADEHSEATRALVGALEGLPLAIELAAARTQLLSAAQIVDRLGSSNRVLASPGQTRHGTLDRTMEWSWALLDEPARWVLTTIARFDHALDPRFLEALWPELDVLSVAEELRTRSWLRVVDGSAGKRWTTLWAMRRFVRQNTGALEELDRRLREWAKERAHELSASWVPFVPEGLHAVRLLVDSGELVNAAKVLSNLFFGASGGVWFRPTLDLAAELLGRLDPETDAVLWAHLARKLSKGAFQFRSPHRAFEWSKAAVEVAPADTSVRLGALAQHVLCLVDEGNRDEAARLLDVLMSERQTVAPEFDVASALLDVASAMHEMGRFAELRQVGRTVLEIGADLHNVDVEARAWIHLAYASYDLGEFDRAAEEIANFDKLFDQRHPRERATLGGAVRAMVALKLGRHEDARQALATLEEIATEIHDEALEFYVLLGWAEWASIHDPSKVRTFLERALANARIQASGKSVAHVRFLLVLEALRRSDFARARASMAGIDEAAVAPGDLKVWNDTRLAVLWFINRDGNPPQTNMGRLMDAVAAAQEGRTHRLERLLDEAPRSDWTVPGMYFLRMDDVARRLARTSPPAPEQLHISRDGRYFAFGSAQTVDLSRRQAIRRILVFLAEQHQAGRTSSVTVQELVDVGWPHEVILHDSALTRVYTTVNRIRALGLHELLVTRDDGYALDPSVEICWLD